MSITCDKCKKEGTEDDPVFYVEAIIKAAPIAESARDGDLLKRIEALKFADLVTPCTVHLHRRCCEPLFIEITKTIALFLKEKTSGKKKANSKTK